MSWNLDTIPVVCLNLDRRIDRWERVQSCPGFREFPNIERWSAVDGKTLDIVNDPRISMIVKYNIANKTRRAHEYINTPGAVGCYLGHASIYEWVLQQNESDVVLVLEDDIDLPAGCYAKLKEYIAKTQLIQDPSKWDIWQVGATINKSTLAPDNFSRDITAFYLTHSYFISRRGAEKFMKYLYPVELHIDGFSSYMASLGLIKIYGSPNALFYQAGSTSDINPGHDCPMCDIPNDYDKNFELITKNRKRVYQLEDGTLKTVAVIAGLYGMYWLMYGSRKRGLDASR
jgi:GR25 family glycosyltransferase involved in LPS biosynthesis